MEDSEVGTEDPTSECDDNEEEDADEDVYSNLPDFHYDKRFDELEESNATLKRQLEELEIETEKLRRSNQKLNRQKNALGRNISVLFTTVHAELGHKNKLIEELRKERDSLIFRRLRQNNVHETVPYVPPVAASSLIPPSLYSPSIKPQETSVLQNENLVKQVDIQLKLEEISNKSLCINEYLKRKSESSSRSSSRHRSQDLSKDTNVKIDSSNFITKSTKNLEILIPLEITPQAKVEKRVSVSQVTKSVSKKSEAIETSCSETESFRNTSKPVSNNVTKKTVSIVPPEPTSSVEETKVSSTPKENSRKVLNDLLKQGLKMSPIKFDKETNFRIPKRVQSTDLSSQSESQLDAENVLENPGVMKSCETSQNITNQENNKDNNGDNETGITERSASSVNISLPSVADCGSSRMRWKIISVSDDSSDDLPEPAEKKRKCNSSDDASTNKYEEKKGSRTKPALLDYKNIEQIRVVNTNINKKNDHRSPMKCNLRVEAVIPEKQKVINCDQRRRSPEGTRRRRNQSRSRRSHSRESSPHSPDRVRLERHTDRKRSPSPRHDSYRARCEDKYRHARRSPVDGRCSPADGRRSPVVDRRRDLRKAADPPKRHQRSSSREFHSRRRSRVRPNKYRDLDKPGSPDRRNRMESSDNSERRRFRSPQKFFEKELRETSEENCRRPSRKRLHEKSSTSPHRDNNKSKLEHINSKQSVPSSTGKNSSKREQLSQKEKEPPRHSNRNGTRQEQPYLNSHENVRSEKNRSPDYVHMAVTHASKFTSEAADLREKLRDLRGKIGKSNEGLLDTGSEGNKKCVLYYTKEDLSFSEASDTESVKEKNASVTSSVPLTEENNSSPIQQTLSESVNVDTSGPKATSQESLNASNTSSSSSSSKNSSSSESDSRSDLEEGEISDER